MVINFIGPPGSGKSTAAHGLTYLLKSNGCTAEMASEYAKDIVLDKSFAILERQEVVFAEQHARISRLMDADFVITDSPLLLSNLYGSHYPESFNQFVRDVALSYESIYFLVRRNHEYETYGRTQTEEESDEMYDLLILIMNEAGVKYIEIDSRDGAKIAYKHLYDMGLIED